jgi:RecB family endonuclease NucS
LFVDFLSLPKKHSETKLKNGLIEHMKQFILELGKDFIFMDQEYKLTVGASTYKADLLFYHRGLQALVAVELKKTKFHPRDLGQLEFYLEALDRDVKRSNENPSIGIVLCPEADRVVVEYAMSRSMSPTMIAEYKRILIPQERMQQQNVFPYLQLHLIRPVKCRQCLPVLRFRILSLERSQNRHRHLLRNQSRLVSRR